MQPLDVGFFKPLNTFMGSAIAGRLREKPGQPLTTEHIASLVGVAFPRAATMSTAINAFRAAGIWPVDRHVFSDADFAPSDVTDQPQISQAQTEPATRHQKAQAEEPIPNAAGENSTEAASSVSNNYIPVQQISPLPSTSGEGLKTRKRTRRSASSVVLTGSPHKESLLMASNNSGPKLKRKNLFQKEGTAARRTMNKGQETICIICGKSQEEDWIQCNKCKGWAHEECADINDEVYYFCDKCS
ncbi:hypothetical protein ANN_27683 [Periplaneta americana]|uniref:Zinc finger PHD-type domain-containing protein n=1 Tax=Periplaneta americana TaxID=6978 RepID=A0ABQ8RWE7_PERAM|nr:hypothetical protein ANN_27683 [Periplaneta americana]